MKRNLLALVLVLAAQISFSAPSFAQDPATEIARIQAIIQNNNPPDTELKSGRLLVGFSALMAFTTQYTYEGLVQSTPSAITNAIETLEKYSGNPLLERDVDRLRDVLVQLAQATTNANTSIVNLSAQIDGLLKLKEKFPQAAFVTSLDQLVSLTKNYLANFQNYTIQVSQLIRKCDEVRDLIKQRSPNLKKELKELSKLNANSQTYSFETIAQQFRAIEAQLAVSYPAN